MELDNKDVKTEELDLWDLMKKIWTTVTSVLVYLLRNSLLFILFIVIGVIYCIILSLSEQKYYSSTIQFCSKNVNSSFIVPQIDALNGLLEGQKYRELALVLQVPEEDIKDIKSIKGLYAFDANRDKIPDYADVNEWAKYSPRDTTLGKMNDYFYVRLDVYSSRPFEGIVSSLKNYISKDEFLRRENEYALEQRKKMLGALRNQVVLLDSFQKVNYFREEKNLGSGQQLYFIDEKGKSLYHLECIQLYEDQLTMEKEMELYSDIITLTQDFSPLANPENPLSFYLKKYLWWFLLLGLVYVILWDNRKFLLSNIFGKKTS